MRKKLGLLKGLKLATAAICFVLFAFNVLGTVLSYFNEATVVMSSIQSTNTKLPLPAFLICNSYPYQHPSASDGNIFEWDEDVYLNITRDPKDFEASVLVVHNPPDLVTLDPKQFSMDILTFLVTV